jgi:hypothetical protein
MPKTTIASGANRLNMSVAVWAALTLPMPLTHRRMLWPPSIPSISRLEPSVVLSATVIDESNRSASAWTEQSRAIMHSPIERLF